MMSGDLVYAAVKGPFAYLWPLLVLPLVAALLCDAAARRLPPTRADWRAAAALAAAPGLLMLALTAVTLWRIVFHPHYDPAWQHVVKYQLTGSLAVLIVVRALLRARGRQLAINALVRHSRSPDPHVAAIAERAGVTLRILPCNEPECFVAGVLRPVVYVSTATTQRLSDAELDAALRHEAAHISARDTALLTLLGFLRDLAPVGGAALNAFQQARERSADVSAIRQSGSIALASALLALARGPNHPLPAIGMSGASSSAWRLQAILGAEECSVASRPWSAAAVCSLGATVAFAAWPTAQQWIIDSMCNCHL